MNEHTMTCGELEAKLADYLDGTLGARDRAAVEAHLASCARCRALVAALEERPAAAMALPPLTPPRDLWSGIESRIQSRVIAIGAQPARWWSDRRQVSLLAAAAALLVAVTMTLTIVVMGHRPPQQQAVITSPRPIGGGIGKLATYQDSLIWTYDQEIAALDSAVQLSQGHLDTATVRIIKKNLAVIDKAIRESREALAKDPQNKYLNEQLARVLDQKVGLLRTAALLPTRT
jgi:hypothetical protein